MSFEVVIQRPTEKPPLTAADFLRIVKEDSSLSGGDREPIIWTDSISGQKRFINIEPEAGKLWTSDIPDDEDGICRFLDKLRSIARLLDARVMGEGEDITEASPVQTPRSGGCASVIICAVVLIAVVSILIVNLV